MAGSAAAAAVFAAVAAFVAAAEFAAAVAVAAAVVALAAAASATAAFAAVASSCFSHPVTEIAARAAPASRRDLTVLEVICGFLLIWVRKRLAMG